jgi:carboxylesterase type B
VPVILGSNRDDGWTFVDRSFPTGLDRLQYERAVRNEFGMDADAALRAYESPASTPKDMLGRMATDVEFTCEARRMARALHHEGSRVFLYSFEYSVDEVNPGRAFHGIEANFVFGNNFTAPAAHALTPADLVVYDAMSRFWRRFMETGDPNSPGVPVQWPTYRPGAFEEPIDTSHSDRYFIFGERLGDSTYLRDRECNFWEPFFFRSTVTAVPASRR